MTSVKHERRVDLLLGSPSKTRVVVDGHDITTVVSSLTVTASVGEPTTVVLTLVPTLVSIEGMAELTAYREVVVKP